MSNMTPEQIAEGARATERARAVLKEGDRLRVRRCGGVDVSVTMTWWDGVWICSKTLDDIHALHIVKVNGVPTSFRDPPAPAS